MTINNDLNIKNNIFFTNYHWINKMIEIGYEMGTLSNHNLLLRYFVITPFERYVSSLIGFGFILNKFVTEQMTESNTWINEIKIDDTLMLHETYGSNKLTSVVFKGFQDKLVVRHYDVYKNVFNFTSRY